MFFVGNIALDNYLLVKQFFIQKSDLKNRKISNATRYFFRNLNNNSKISIYCSYKVLLTVQTLCNMEIPPNNSLDSYILDVSLPFNAHLTHAVCMIAPLIASLCVCVNLQDLLTLSIRNSSELS